jgi:hypothetical protein
MKRLRDIVKDLKIKITGHPNEDGGIESSLPKYTFYSTFEDNRSSVLLKDSHIFKVDYAEGKSEICWVASRITKLSVSEINKNDMKVEIEKGVDMVTGDKYRIVCDDGTHTFNFTFETGGTETSYMCVVKLKGNNQSKYSVIEV